jgi:hypothetical protein
MDCSEAAETAELTVTYVILDQWPDDLVVDYQGKGAEQ